MVVFYLPYGPQFVTYPQEIQTVTWFLETLISMGVRALGASEQQNKKASAPSEVF